MNKHITKYLQLQPKSITTFRTNFIRQFGLTHFLYNDLDQTTSTNTALYGRGLSPLTRWESSPPVMSPGYYVEKSQREKNNDRACVIVVFSLTKMILYVDFLCPDSNHFFSGWDITVRATIRPHTDQLMK